MSVNISIIVRVSMLGTLSIWDCCNGQNNLCVYVYCLKRRTFPFTKTCIMGVVLPTFPLNVFFCTISVNAPWSCSSIDFAKPVSVLLCTPRRIRSLVSLRVSVVEIVALGKEFQAMEAHGVSNVHVRKGERLGSATAKCGLAVRRNAAEDGRPTEKARVKLDTPVKRAKERRV